MNLCGKSVTRAEIMVKVSVSDTRAGWHGNKKTLSKIKEEEKGIRKNVKTLKQKMKTSWGKLS